MSTPQTEPREFRAETRQVLDILIHSLYSEREIFLRELVSNASDALNRFKLESLTNETVLDPEAELAVWLEADPDTRTLTLRDTGVGMTQEEMVEYLGTIAHSGAKAVVEALREAEGDKAALSKDVIGQFGVGFYSVFMVADEVTVTSRSYRLDAQAARWHSDGQGSYTVAEVDKTERGTTIIIHLKEDAAEFAQTSRLREIIKTHSDFVAFPVYLKEDKGFTQVNQRTALWRESSRNVTGEQYKNFYQQLTLDFQEPLRTLHFSADVPIQFYALLFVPSRRDYKLFKQDDYGLKLYARKVLIKEDYKELLPPYLRFLEGVVDSEDIPLNVARESVQASPALRRIRTALLGRVASELKKMAEGDAETYRRFFGEFGPYLKEGVASDPEAKERFVELLRFPSSLSEDDLTSLAQYVARMRDGQKEIYYLLGDDLGVVRKSAHLGYFKRHDLEVLYLTDPMDAFMLMGLTEYNGKTLKNIDEADLEVPDTADSGSDSEETEGVSDDAFKLLTAKFKEVLGERVADVRESKLLVEGTCRLVNPSDSFGSNVQRMQRLMNQSSGVPKKILELNRNSELVQNLATRFQASPNDALVPVLIEQLFENELVMEGLHPNPAEMIPRIQRLMAEASKQA